MEPKQEKSFLSYIIGILVYTSPILIIAAITGDVFRKDYQLNGNSFFAKDRFYSNVLPLELFQNLTCDFTGDLSRSCFAKNNYCGRHLTDFVLNSADSNNLFKIANNGFSVDKSEASAYVYDLSSNKVHFNNMALDVAKKLNENELITMSAIKSKILKHIQEKLNMKSELKLGELNLFYKMTTKDAHTRHDQVLQHHIRSNQNIDHNRLSMLVMVFLDDHHYEYEGGRFMFKWNHDESHMQKTSNQPGKLVIDPKVGRILYFTNGNENAFELEQITGSYAYAYITSIECA